jgi:hypothetical protein
MPNKVRGLSVERWAEVRKAYEAGESVLSLSKRFGIRRPTIDAHRDKETWIVHPTVQMHGEAAKTVQARAQAQVIDIATKRVVEKMEESGALDAHAQAIDTLLQIQAPLYAKAAKLIEKTLDKAIGGTLRLGVTQGETTAVTDILNALSKFSTETRKGAGLRDGTPTVASENEDDRRIEEAVLIVRERASA